MNKEKQEVLKVLKNALDRAENVGELSFFTSAIDEDLLRDEEINNELFKEEKYRNIFMHLLNPILERIRSQMHDFEVAISKKEEYKRLQTQEISHSINKKEDLFDFISDYAKKFADDEYENCVEYGEMIKSDEVIEEVYTCEHEMDMAIYNKQWYFVNIFKKYGEETLIEVFDLMHQVIKKRFPLSNEEEFLRVKRENLKFIKTLSGTIEEPKKEELQVIPPLLDYKNISGSLSMLTSHLLLDNKELKRRKVQDIYKCDDEEKRTLFSLQEEKRGKYVVITQLPSRLHDIKGSKYLDAFDMAVQFTIGNLCDQVQMQNRLNNNDTYCYSFTYTEITQAVLSITKSDQRVRQANIDRVKESIDKMRYTGLIVNLSNDRIQLHDKDGELITAEEYEEYSLMAVRSKGKTTKGTTKEYLTLNCQPLLYRYVKAKNQLFYIDSDYFMLPNCKANIETRVVLSRSIIERIKRIKTRLNEHKPTNCKMSLISLLEDTGLKNKYPLNNSSKKQNFVTLVCNILDHLVKTSQKKAKLGEEPLLKYYREYKTKGVIQGFKIEFYEKEK